MTVEAKPKVDRHKYHLTGRTRVLASKDKWAETVSCSQQKEWSASVGDTISFMEKDGPTSAVMFGGSIREYDQTKTYVLVEVKGEIKAIRASQVTRVTSRELRVESQTRRRRCGREG